MFAGIIEELHYDFENSFKEDTSYDQIEFDPIYLYHVTRQPASEFKSFFKQKPTSFAPSIIQCILGIGYYDHFTEINIFRTKVKHSHGSIPYGEPDYILTQEIILSLDKSEIEFVGCVKSDSKDDFGFNIEHINYSVESTGNVFNNIYCPNFQNRANRSDWHNQVKEYRDLICIDMHIDFVNKSLFNEDEVLIHSNNHTDIYREKI